MLLRSVRLRNYRRFADAFLEFPEGVIAIVGPNGAGKSTLLEAVAWALYGHDAARTSKDLLRRAQAAPGDDVEVRLEFELDGSSYVMTRRLRGRSQQSEAQVEVDGNLLVAPGANSADLATQFVSRFLAMDRAGFEATVFARQGDLRALGDAKPGERKRLLLSLLGIDEVDHAIATARTEKREAALRLEEVRRRVQLADALKAREADLERQREPLTEEHAALVTACRTHEAVLSQRAERRQALERARERFLELRARLDALQRSLQAREEQRVRLGAETRLLESRAQEAAAVRGQLDAHGDLDARIQAWETYRELVARHEAPRSELRRIREELDRWDRDPILNGPNGHDPEALHAEVTSLRTATDASTSRLAEVEVHARHLDQERRRIQTETVEGAAHWRDAADLGPRTPCPVCERPLEEAYDRLSARAAATQHEARTRVESLTTEVARLIGEAGSLQRSRDEARKTLEERERALHEARRHRDREALAAAERARLRERAAAIEAALADLPPLPNPAPEGTALARQRAERDRLLHALARLDAEAARLPRIRDELSGLTAQTAQGRVEIEEATRELSLLQYSEGGWEGAARDEAEARAAWHEVVRRRDVAQERLLGIETALDRVRADRAAAEPARAEADGIEQRVALGELLAADRGDVGLLPEFKRHLISRIRPSLAHAAGGLVAAMTDGRYQDLTLDEDYTVQLYDGAQSWPLERFSGGEADVVHLALRLAVSALLAEARRSRRLSFVALDEVLASQDAARRDSVLAAMKGLGAQFRQVLLVTHLEEVRERVDHIVHVRPDGQGSAQIMIHDDSNSSAALER